MKYLDKRASRKTSQENITRSKIKIVRNGYKVRRVSQDNIYNNRIRHTGSVILPTPYELKGDSTSTLPPLQYLSKSKMSQKLRKRVRQYIQKNALAKSKPNNSQLGESQLFASRVDSSSAHPGGVKISLSAL